MIYLYSGTPGSGKSLRAAYTLIEWLKRKRSVVANFPVALENYFRKKQMKKLGRFDYYDNSELTPEILKAYARKHHKPGREHQTLLIIDECASIFNSRQWNQADRMSWIHFFQQHRKLGYDVILISQNDRLIDRQIRAFIETEFKHRAIGNYKAFGWILSKLGGGVFIAVEYWYGVREKIGSSFFRINRRKAKIYDSFKLFE